MKQHITVVPSDRLIIVDGDALYFDFPAPANLHAIQWHDGAGYMEFTDDFNHNISGQTLYDEDVAPFVTLWEAEKARMEEEASRPPTPEQQAEARAAAIKAELASIDAKSARPLRAITAGMATEADRAYLAGLESQAVALRDDLAELMPLSAEA